MASSENQGLQIALIILFCLVVLLSVFTFTYFTKNDALQAQLKEQTDARLAAEANSLKDQKLLVDTMGWLGIEDPGEADIDRMTKLTTAFEDDMTKASPPPGRKNYHAAVEELLNAKVQAEEARDTVQKQYVALQDKNTTFELAAQTKVKEADDAKKKAEGDLATEQAKFNDELKKKDDKNNELAAKLNDLQQKIALDAETATKEKDDLNKRIATLVKTVEDKTNKINELQGTGIDVADDGEIRLVNQRTRTVWINLGRADLLRQQTSFVVHAPGSKTDLASRKGTIEVTKILDDHLAECRILDDSVVDPFVPGDKIYTTLWDPGRPEHFAIAGRIRMGADDIDGLTQLRSLLNVSGAVIDGEVLEDGTGNGQLTSQTRYLIVGDSTQRCKEKFDEMLANAKAMGIETMTVDKFLDYSGWKSPTTSIVFGKGGNADQFPPDQPDGGRARTTGSTTEMFRQRRPVAAPRPASAY